MKYWTLTIQKEYQKQEWGRTRKRATCICDCWVVVERRIDWLKQGNNTNCWCIKKWIEKAKELIGNKYNMLTIIDIRHNYRNDIVAGYRCDCWKIGETSIYNITRQISCWCNRWTTNWLYKKRPYTIRVNMKMSCDDEKHQSYHRRWYRGIRYDNKWATFQWRWEDQKEQYAEDKYFTRKNVFEDFIPSNCSREHHYNVSKFDLF